MSMRKKRGSISKSKDSFSVSESRDNLNSKKTFDDGIDRGSKTSPKKNI